MEASQKTQSSAQHPSSIPAGSGGLDVAELLERARLDVDTVLKQLDSRLVGLSDAEANSRLKQVGPNEIARQKRQSGLMRLLSNVRNPLVMLLVALSPFLSYRRPPGDGRDPRHGGAGGGAALRPGDSRRQRRGAAASDGQQHRDGGPRRQGPRSPAQACWCRAMSSGSAAGDMVPADVRVLSAKDLFLNQAALTGEALPVEKKADAAAGATIAEPARAAEPLLPGLQRGERRGDRRGRPHRRADLLRLARREHRRAATAHQLRQGHQPVHLADDPLHRRHGAGGVPDQRTDPRTTGWRRSCSPWRWRSG